mmetsp:Transcript_32159/g.76775  ORF Transcript_32159/g.76775 Transcript_32159/m.76775 type:complete len:255 (-) Transcript_32159:455-1219(-)
MSPIPERPASVSGRAPIAVANHRISALPCVTRADMALVPRPSPSQMPAAIARTFFRAPATSTPRTSSVMLTRKYLDVSNLETFSAASGLLEAATTEVGRRSIISCAKEGPETTTTCPSASSRPSASGMTSHISFRVPSSTPLDTATTGMSGGTSSRMAPSASREDCTGTAWMSTSQPSRASAASVVAPTFFGKSNSERYLGLICLRLMNLHTDLLRTIMVTMWPLRATWAAMAVPNAPPPMTTTFIFSQSSECR